VFLLVYLIFVFLPPRLRWKWIVNMLFLLRVFIIISIILRCLLTDVRVFMRRHCSVFFATPLFCDALGNFLVACFPPSVCFVISVRGSAREDRVCVEFSWLLKVSFFFLFVVANNDVSVYQMSFFSASKGSYLFCFWLGITRFQFCLWCLFVVISWVWT